MSFPAVSFIIIIIALAIILWIIARKTPLLAMIQLDTMVRERQLDVKKRMARSRVEELLGAWGRKIRKACAPAKAWFLSLTENLRQKIKIWESSPKNSHQIIDPNKLNQALDLADKLFLDEQLSSAEKKYIEVIGQDSKNIRAYLGLATLYVSTKEYEGARELYGHVLKLDDQSFPAYLGLAKVLEILKRPEEAFAVYEKALFLEPSNPKLLDCFIELSILLNRRETAEANIKKLAEVNPENEKLQEFWERLNSV